MSLLLFAAVAVFSSLCQVAQDDKWQTFAPEGSGFEVLMPDQPKVVDHHVKPLRDREITVHLASASIRDGKAMFMVAYHDLDFDVVDDDKIRDVLDGGVKGSLFNVLGKLIKHERIELDKHPGRHFEYAGNRFDQKILADSRIYLVGRRIYQITVIRWPEVDVAAETEKFAGSFKLVAIKPSNSDSAPTGEGDRLAPPASEPQKRNAPQPASR